MHLLEKFKILKRFDNPWELLAHALLFRRTRLSVHRIDGVEAIVDNTAADAGSIRNCIAQPMYLQFLPGMDLGPGPVTLLDLGANVGGFALMLKVAGIPLGRLVCVEFNPSTFVRLQFNIRYNFGPDFPADLLNAALSGDGREVAVELGVGDTNDSIYRGTRRDGNCAGVSRRTITGITLDDLFARFFGPDEAVDLCKIDVEGAENEVLCGPSSHSISRCRYLLMEIHHVGLYDELIAAIAGHGFRKLGDEGLDRRGVHLFENAALARGGSDSR